MWTYRSLDVLCTISNWFLFLSCKIRTRKYWQPMLNYCVTLQNKLNHCSITRQQWTKSIRIKLILSPTRFELNRFSSLVNCSSLAYTPKLPEMISCRKMQRRGAPVMSLRRGQWRLDDAHVWRLTAAEVQRNKRSFSLPAHLLMLPTYSRSSQRSCHPAQTQHASMTKHRSIQKKILELTTASGNSLQFQTSWTNIIY